MKIFNMTDIIKHKPFIMRLRGFILRTHGHGYIIYYRVVGKVTEDILTLTQARVYNIFTNNTERGMKTIS